MYPLGALQKTIQVLVLMVLVSHDELFWSHLRKCPCQDCITAPSSTHPKPIKLPSVSVYRDNSSQNWHSCNIWTCVGAATGNKETQTFLCIQRRSLYCRNHLLFILLISTRQTQNLTEDGHPLGAQLQCCCPWVRTPSHLPTSFQPSILQLCTFWCCASSGEHKP